MYPAHLPLTHLHVPGVRGRDGEAGGEAWRECEEGVLGVFDVSGVCGDAKYWVGVVSVGGIGAAYFRGWVGWVPA